MLIAVQLFAKLLHVALSKRLLDSLIRHKVLAGTEHRHVLRCNFSTVVDIGANRGQFSLAALHWTPNAKIFAFEPLTNPASIFRDLFGDDERVTLYQAAIGPLVGEFDMHISARDDSSSLLPISKVQTDRFPGTHEVAKAKVQVAPLDTFIQSESITSPALLKLDVQGYEFEALIGCESLLYNFDNIYCECSFISFYSGQKLAADVISYLSNHGFQLHSIINPTLNERSEVIQADFLFVRQTDSAI